jgi:hypothetical protein
LDRNSIFQDTFWALSQLRTNFLFEPEAPSLDPKLKFRTSFGSETEVPEDVSESLGSETKVRDQAWDPNLKFHGNYETTTVGTTCNLRLERQTKFQAVNIFSSRGTLVGICSARETLVQIAVNVEFQQRFALNGGL